MSTTDHGLEYPTTSDPVQVPQDIQALAESVEAALDTYETWNSFTPTWTSAGFSSVGAGFSQGFYMLIGKLLIGTFRIELGAGSSTSAGTFAMTLPVAAYAFSGTGIQGALGSWTARDDSGPKHYSGTLGGWNAGNTAVSFNGTPPAAGGTSSSRIDSNDPVPWTTSDVLSGFFLYRTV